VINRAIAYRSSRRTFSSLAVALSAFVTIATLLAPAVANAQVIIDMGAFTCDQYLAMSPAMSRDFSAWMSGWFSNQTGRRVVDVLVHQKNIAIVKSWCQSHPQAGVMTALQSAIGPQ
jgi:hypothetical protein